MTNRNPVTTQHRRIHQSVTDRQVQATTPDPTQAKHPTIHNLSEVKRLTNLVTGPAARVPEAVAAEAIPAAATNLKNRATMNQPASPAMEAKVVPEVVVLVETVQAAKGPMIVRPTMANPKTATIRAVQANPARRPGSGRAVGNCKTATARTVANRHQAAAATTAK
jgi:hypothetical protein